MRKKIINIEELQQCACFNVRLMARELTNEYNNTLKFSGINSTQIPILAILNIYNQIETSKIAKILNLEISTTRRNLNILIRNKLIRIVSKGINGNLLTLTKKGFTKLEETLPIWRNSNKKNKGKVKNYVKILKKISM
ncbi:MAG: hypothetical protein CMP41_01635 [Rickettsiales bacterium]|nr:hypothetical protein [Rickettsiales bacterium]|tara:strand:+ start:1683 stop:2096 length:414 start_codon:yes stop_codon:yes gene_type:complete